MKLGHRTSKRMTTKKRVKIDKKVREHNRKMRKQQRQGAKRKTKIVVPRLAPFKDDMMNAVEDLKRQKFAEQAEKKIEKAKKRKADAKAKRLEESITVFEKRQIHGFEKELLEVIEGSDVIVHVLDSRDPEATRSERLEKYVLEAGKKLVIVLNKSDLIPNEIKNGWISRLRDEFPSVAFRAKRPCDGTENLMSVLAGLSRSAVDSSRLSIVVGVVGMPNVGKSSIINALKRERRCCEVGSVPGLTRSLKRVKLDKHITLIDSPGVTHGQSEHRMVLCNCIDASKISDLSSCVQEILDRSGDDSLMIHYNIPKFNGRDDFLAQVARRFGLIEKGGIVNSRKAALKVVRDWSKGTLRGNHIEVPTNTAAEPCVIVDALKPELDLDKMFNQEDDERMEVDVE